MNYWLCDRPQAGVGVKEYDYQCLQIQHFIISHAARSGAMHVRSLWFLIISSRGLQCDLSISPFPCSKIPISLLTSSLTMDLMYMDNAIENASGNLLSFADASVNVCSAHIHKPIKNQEQDILITTDHDILATNSTRPEITWIVSSYHVNMSNTRRQGR